MREKGDDSDYTARSQSIIEGSHGRIMKDTLGPPTSINNSFTQSLTDISPAPPNLATTVRWYLARHKGPEGQQALAGLNQLSEHVLW